MNRFKEDKMENGNGWTQPIGDAVVAAFEVNADGFLKATKELHSSYAFEDEIIKLQDEVQVLENQKSFIITMLEKKPSSKEGQTKLEVLNNMIDELNKKQFLIKDFIDYSQAAFTLVNELQGQLNIGKKTETLSSMKVKEPEL